MVRAVRNGEVIAESDDTVVVEGNHYFPIESVRVDLLRPSSKKTVCSWKGVASYHDLIVGGKENRDAVWFYPEPKSAAAAIKDRVAFWRGVTIETDAAPTTGRSLLSRFRRQGNGRVTAEAPAGEHAHAGPTPVVDLTDATFFDSLDGHATIIDLWAPWCGPCKALHPMFDHLAHHHADERVHFARVNVDQSPKVAAQLGMMSIPTLVLCDLGGNEVHRRTCRRVRTGGIRTTESRRWGRGRHRRVARSASHRNAVRSSGRRTRPTPERVQRRHPRRSPRLKGVRSSAQRSGNRRRATLRS